MKEYHLLHIEDLKNTKTYYLNVATISIGRDFSNGIVINDPSVSRHHAILIRMPLDDGRYSYELVDGDLEGCRSQNGIFINNTAYHRKVLATGDHLQIGATNLSYIIASMTPEEYQAYFDAHKVNFHSLKQDVLNPIGTVVTKLHRHQ